MLEKIKEVIDLLNEIDSINDKANETISLCDKKEQDILHFLEKETIPLTSSYNILKKIKEIRQERRIAKNDLQINARFKNLEQKLLNKNNRQLLLADLYKIEKKQKEEVYKNRVYSENLEEVLK